MIINSEELIGILNSAIIEYNNQFYKEEDKEKQIPCIDDNGEISEENLSKIKRLSLVINTRYLTEEEISIFNQELQTVLGKMNLQVFMINVLSKKSPINFNIDFLNALNENIENLQLRGIDLSDKEPEIFSKFKNLKYLAVEKCNIANPNIISDLDGNVLVSIKSNQIDPRYYEMMVKLLIKHNGQIETSDNKLENIAKAYAMKKIDIQTYLDTMSDVDYEKIEGLSISIDDSFMPSDDKLEEIIGILNNMRGVTLVTSINNFLRISNVQKLTIPSKIIISGANELSTQIMDEYPNIESVEIQDNQNSTMLQAEPYKRDEYILVRKRIDEIISKIQIPGESTKDREKMIFSQIYRKLAEQIEYDYYAISEEGKKDTKLEITCRNLYGGLVKGKCVCAGYADILRNVLACCGIEAKFARGGIDIDGGARYDLKDPCGHAWNMVTLDGKDYWTDLTWDRASIIAKRYPLEFCLKSTKDFGHKGFKVCNISEAEKNKCTESLSIEEQVELFTGEKGHEVAENESNISYLSSMVMCSAENRNKSITNKKYINSIIKISCSNKRRR